MGLLDRAPGFARRGAKKVVSRVLGKILGPSDDDPFGTYGGRDPDELTRVAKEMSERGGSVEAGATVRPKASRTSGARFDHYPVLEQPAKGKWDLGPGLVEPVGDGRGQLGKEALFVAIVSGDDSGAAMEEALAVLHPHLDPQYIVAIARCRGADAGTVYFGDVEVIPPQLPLILAFDLPDNQTLVFKAASVGPAAPDELRSILIDTLLRDSPRGPMAGGVSAQMMGYEIKLGG